MAPTLSILLITVGVAPPLFANTEAQEAKTASVSFNARPRKNSWFVGEEGQIIDISIKNNSKHPVILLKLQKLIWTFQLDLKLQGKKQGRLRRYKRWRQVSAPRAADYNEIPPGGKLTFPVDIVNDMKFLPRIADSYTLTFTLKLKDGTVLRVQCNFDVKPAPPLEKRTKTRILRGPKSARWVICVERGVGRVDKESKAIFVFVRTSESGSTKLPDLPDWTIRLGRADEKTRVEGMVYNPFPRAVDTIVEIHLLVSKPGDAQRYFVVDVSSGFKVSKRKILSTVKRYKLHQKPLGPVTLVPVKQ